jgi:peptidylprolyl isomerase
MKLPDKREVVPAGRLSAASLRAGCSWFLEIVLAMRHVLSLALAATLVTGCFRHAPRIPESIPAIDGEPRTLFALRYIDKLKGTGNVASRRRCFFVHYTGWLTDGKKFDSSRDTTANGTPREPLSFPQGSREVIAGWDLGFEGMRVGGQRRLFIPSQLAYGEVGIPSVIPPRAELIFDVELMAVADTIPHPSDNTAVPQCPTWKAVSRG